MSKVSKSRIVRAGQTETCNAFDRMPDSVEKLSTLKNHLEDMRAANVAHHLALMEAARAQGVQIICFGELFAGPYFGLDKNPLWRGLAEDAQKGRTVTEVAKKAKELQMIVIAPIFERTAGDKFFNTAVVINEKGRILGKYRKTHIPFGKNEQGSFAENFYYQKSDGNNGKTAANISKNKFFPVFKTSLGRVGIAICYDRHFEGVLSTLAKEGAELVFSPAVTFGAKSQMMWPLEFQVDAARHGIFIGGSNRSGSEPPWNQPYFGQSHFAGPNGRQSNLSIHSKLVICDLDLGALKRPDPAGWNLPRDVRPEIYS